MEISLNRCTYIRHIQNQVIWRKGRAWGAHILAQTGTGSCVGLLIIADAVIPLESHFRMLKCTLGCIIPEGSPTVYFFSLHNVSLIIYPLINSFMLKVTRVNSLTAIKELWPIWKTIPEVIANNRFQKHEKLGLAIWSDCVWSEWVGTIKWLDTSNYTRW